MSVSFDFDLNHTEQLAMTDSQIPQIIESGNFYCLMGASLHTGNLGVSALSLSVIEAIAKRQPDWTPLLLDYSRGNTTAQISLSDGSILKIGHVGTSPSRRFWRSDNLLRMQVCQTLGFPHVALNAFHGSKGVLDVSGGDSFTDLYGPARFQDVTLRKSIAIKAGGKLILMPQTYGPYSTEKTRRVARNLIKKSQVAWARDPRSFERLSELMAGANVTDRLQQGVDVAFGLPLLEPEPLLAEQVRSWRESPETVIGINISGLIYNGGAEAQEQYGLKDNYRELIDQLVRKFLSNDDVRVVFVPHVVPHGYPLESDTIASREVWKKLPEEYRNRVDILPELDDPRIAKWIISHFDWFCGTRMHSTIASLSTKVPTGALAYSLKTKGVFETCGAGDCVVELRDAQKEEAISGMLDCFHRRDEVRNRLEESMARVTEVVERQADQIVATMNGQTVPEAVTV